MAISHLHRTFHNLTKLGIMRGLHLVLSAPKKVALLAIAQINEFVDKGMKKGRIGSLPNSSRALLTAFYSHVVNGLSIRREIPPTRL